MKGYVSPGEHLPSMRELAKDLKVSLITTKRAYEDLEKNQNEFIEKIHKDVEDVEAILSQTNFKFRSSFNVLYHYRKHKTDYSMKEYLDVIPIELIQADNLRMIQYEVSINF